NVRFRVAKQFHPFWVIDRLGCVNIQTVVFSPLRYRAEPEVFRRIVFVGENTGDVGASLFEELKSGATDLMISQHDRLHKLRRTFGSIRASVSSRMTNCGRRRTSS